VHNYDEAARFYYALYSLPEAGADGPEKGLAGLIDVLLTAPEQPIRLGAADLSFYRDVAALDPYPGFLNGILSLLFNSVNPAQHYATQDRSSLAYFHRARAAELLVLFDSRFADSVERPELHAKLLEAYATYGDSQGVIRGAGAFLAAFPAAPQRTRVALLLAEAFARTEQVEEEFATYDRLLEELAARADGVPLGRGITQDRRQRAALGARSPDYARVLDRYIARLVSLKRRLDALALYRREIDRNPDDPGLYERLAAFLEQNHLGDEVEQVYRRALERFDDRSWYHRLARWYLRRKRRVEFDQLTREVVRIFSGGELEDYFRQVVGRGKLDPLLYRQVNLYAHDRFPHNLTFVRNLLAAYRSRGTHDSAAWERLLRRHWFHAEDLRNRFFEFLSKRRRLGVELDAVRASHPAAAASRWPELIQANLAAAQFIAESELWQSHFEAAASVLRALASADPTDGEQGRRAAAVHRSLAPFQPEHTQAAVAIEESLHRFDPGDRATLTRIGEIYADREMFDRARPYWDRVAQTEPGKPAGYVEAATVFWDYFQFDDALRLLEEGREKLSNLALFAYETGAIHENKRDQPRAVQEYVKGVMAAPGNSLARRRLLRLARRPALAPLVEEATAELVAGASPPLPAVDLRVAVLEAQERREDLQEFLLRLTANTSDWELLEKIDAIAERQGMDSVRERSLERQIALTHDPVDRLRLRLALASFHESKRNLEAAASVLESLYRENPTILGIARANVDFNWRQERRERAIDLLLEAADASYPRLGKQFTFEAARKATQAGFYERARELLAALLADEPFHDNYLAAVADTYASEGDDSGLRNFYLATIESLRQAPLSRQQRTARFAALRRGLIPALTRLNEPQAAVDQYIEIINRFPEDDGLIQEAAFYAERHRLQERLIGYYTRTAEESPRDYRWPTVLAHLETHFEHFPEAIAAYSRAIEVRPDRTDLHLARASLQERLLRFEDALRSYEQIYQLAYQDPQWMEKTAELHLPLGQTDAAVEALRKALLEGRPQRPEHFFAMARKLESWGLLSQARPFAERAVELAGRELLLDANYARGARDYTRILTRLRQYAPAFARLQAARSGVRASRTQNRFLSALGEMGTAVARYFTPEEKAAFALFLEKEKQALNLGEFARTLLPLAQQAGLAELEARWRYQLIMAWPGQGEAKPHERRLRELQQRRMKFAELAGQLEAYWKVYPQRPDKRHLLEQAARAYRAAGDTEEELRLLRWLQEQLGLSGRLLDRYFELLLADDPNRLVSIAGSDRSSGVRDAAANFAIARGDAELALAAVKARGNSLPPVWSRAYAGLVGLHYASQSSQVKTGFLEALGPDPIGRRLGKTVERKEQLAGDIWFYYGSRYGEYLGLVEDGNPDDYLPAELEHTPGRASAYFALADDFRERGAYDPALIDYDHALELDPNRGYAHDRVAAILWEQGQREQATARWRQALKAYSRRQDQGRVPEAFWTNVRITLENIGRRALLPVVREEIDQLLRTYVRRNGSYRVQPLLEGALTASANPTAGVEWIVDLSGAASDPVGFLTEILNASWLPREEHEPVLKRILAGVEKRVARAHGTARSYAEQTRRRWQLRWITYLADTQQTVRARAELDKISELVPQTFFEQAAVLEIRLEAQLGTLEALLARYQQDPKKAASDKALRDAAAALRAEDQDGAARQVLEFLYTRALERHDFNAANFLGLAEARLEGGDLEAALSLLRRMTLVSGSPFETHEPAAALLDKMGYPAEAAEFRAALVKVRPWDAEARARLADVLLKARRDREEALSLAAAVTSESTASYATRVTGARLLRRAGGKAVATTSAELRLLAAGDPIDASAAEQDFFYHARVVAAEETTEPAVRLRLLLAAIGTKPQADAPRVSLMHAAIETQRYQTAVAAMEPLLEANRLHYLLQQSERLNERSRTALLPIASAAHRFLARGGFTTEQRAAAARALAEAYQELNRLGAAELLWRIALELEPSATSRGQLQRRIEALRAVREQRQQNALRRPVVSKNLEQDRVVRPRLTPALRAPGGELP
jgi:tetratricopeptide (TPR) repeat protein